MRRNIPSLSALQAFESAARLSSFTRASGELNLTQSAVSRHVRALEEELGCLLFHRSKQRVSLTEAGRQYLDGITGSLDAIEASTARLRAREKKDGVLTLVTLPTFGSRWLAPRLSEFARDHPEIDLRLSVRTDLVGLPATDFDAAIFFGQPTAPHTVFDLLIGDELVPVCSPTLIEPGTGSDDLARLATYPLLELAIPDAWRKLFSSAGRPELSGTPVSRYEYFALGIQSAIAGLGILLVHPFLIADDLAAGRLVIPSSRTVQSDFNYYLTYPRSRSGQVSIRKFQRWILREAAATTQDCHLLMQKAAVYGDGRCLTQSGGTPSL
ncbi:DNA-binding transcriptional LysR family regulator [Rhodoligotrophos appendicifer]|uniref:LysR substrate-binding domain-containing protein n=1 Tax=Rhodoligotrophos appendicifer TaxID=987056 RepID=UPI0011867A60|nr:LysR substrate-binding domain-containing protein [Rhodoligotrophos appendicifer]